MRLWQGIAIVGSLCGFTLAVAAPSVERHGAVTVFRIEGMREFAEATELGAVTRACAPAKAALEQFFLARGATLEPSLLRRSNGLPFCHIFYTPTVPGFRASAEDEPITGVFGALDPAHFVAGRAADGDSLDILAQVLSRAPGSVQVALTVNRDYDERHWPAAVERHFGHTAHQIETRPSRAAGTQPWAQDYVKAGWVGDERTVDVHVRQLRKKLGPALGLTTVWGIGYRLD